MSEQPTKDTTIHTERRRERRNLLAQLFVALLVGLACQEMVQVAWDSLRHDGLTLGTIVLGGTFLLTALRFFIGVQFHIIDPDLLAMRGSVWFYDFLVIVLEMLILTLLAGVTTLPANLDSVVRFPALFACLLGLDVVWIVSQWAFGRLFRSCARRTIPWPWAWINTGLLLILGILWLARVDLLSPPSLIVLGLSNLAAFAIDVFLVDKAGLA